MRSISLLVLAGLVALSCGYLVPDRKVNTFNTDTDFIYKQKVVLELLQHVHQNPVLLKLSEDVKLFKFEENYNNYTNVEAVREFVTYYNNGLLPMDEIFTIYNPFHRDQVISLFNVFYHAKDFETFYKSLAWARFNVNEGMFTYAATVALFNRPDTRGIEFPAPYEIHPYYFFNAKTIQRAQNSKMQGFYGMKKVEDVQTIIIPTNYTDYDYYMTNVESKISYFTEDIGLNTYYYYFHAEYPFWMTGKNYNTKRGRRGEQHLFVHQQLLARCFLERLSHDIGIIPEFSWYQPIRTGYYPALRYYNGQYFPARDNYYVYNERNYYDINMVEDYERRIRDAIDVGFIIMPDGTHFDLTKPESIEHLGNLIQFNGDSVNRRFYGYFVMMSKLLLGGSVTDLHTFKYDRKVLPSVLEHYETTLRDPVSWQLFKRFIKCYWHFKDTLPYYKKNELMFDGVRIQSVEMGKLVTYFDKFDSDITNAVDVEMYDRETLSMEKKSDLVRFGKLSHYNGEDFVIKARQFRLNHLPFTFTLHVYSDHIVKSVVRVFLGPKYDEYGNVYDINENRENFVLLDLFQYELVVGENMITRNSNDFTWFVKDTTTYFDLYKATMMVNDGKSKWESTDYTEGRYGIPDRLMLPRGKKGGMPFQFFFMVTPLTPSPDGYYVDALPFGYPFDRKIEKTYWYTPNMYYYDVNIFHKKEIEVNAVHTSNY